MQKRFVALWFHHLSTDWLSIRKPELRNKPFVFTANQRGRKIITAVSSVAEQQGISAGTALADARAIVPELEVIDEKPGRNAKLLKAIGEWCIRYTPTVATDHPDGLIFDASGCAHLWRGEQNYLKEIAARFKSKGYNVRLGMADTVGAAWAVSRFGKADSIINSGEEAEALLPLPAAALRLEPAILQRLQKLGLLQIQNFIGMPRQVLRRRFGEALLQRLGQALGSEAEHISPLQLTEPYQERLPCLEPIRTATAIEMAVKILLEQLCRRLQQEEKGLRTAVLKAYRIDGKVEQLQISTNKASHHISHLSKLIELKIPSIEPALGIELFTLEAPLVEDLPLAQEALWTKPAAAGHQQVTELLDRLATKIGTATIHRYLPAEHYWPERSFKEAEHLLEKAPAEWPGNRPRPTLLLSRPGRIDVTAPIPDYPPISFRYKGKLHYIKKAEGPERIEREWWIEPGEHRDYYQVEDESGQRYWLYRSGHYTADASAQWFLHGFFA